MKFAESIPRSRQQQLVADDKFEKHIRLSRLRDIASLQAIFTNISARSLVKYIERHRRF